MATFKHINKDHVLDALREIDSLPDEELYSSTGYDLLFEGRRYPPKEVLRFADDIAGRRNFNDFSGGKITNDPLIKLGFNIVLKDTNESISLGYSRNSILEDDFPTDNDEFIKKINNKEDNDKRVINLLYSDDSFGLFTINESVPPLYKKLGKSHIPWGRVLSFIIYVSK